MLGRITEARRVDLLRRIKRPDQTLPSNPPPSFPRPPSLVSLALPLPLPRQAPLCNLPHMWVCGW